MPEPGRKHSRRRIWILSAVGAALVLLGYLGFSRSDRTAELTFDTAKVDRGRIAARVTATGTLSPLVRVQVGSQISGRIQALYVDFNSPVKKGQIIARIDPQLFDAAVQQSRANLIAARANLDRAKALEEDARMKHERAASLAAQNLVSESDLDTARANAESAKASVAAAGGAVEQARAALHQAEINQAYTTIYSPTDGIVISRDVDVGQTVAASLSAPTLFTIAEDLRKMQVDTSVAEADVGKLRPGMEASFFVDAYPSERFKGAIRQIRNAPQTLQNVVTYDAVLDVDNPDLKLKPGMTANVTFIVAERDAVLRVPNAALRFRPPPEMLSGEKVSGGVSAAGRSAGGGEGRRPRGIASDMGPPDRRSVWVLRGEKPVQLSIRPGVSDGTLTEMVEGDLQEGDRVIVGVLGGASPSSSQGGAGSFRRVF